MKKTIKSDINYINSKILNKLGPDFYNLKEMDELYFSAVNNFNSDLSFVNLHTDGPFYFCNVYRVLIFINGNRNTDTIINRSILFNLQKYDIIGFDYHNDLHYIKNNGNFIHDNNNRIIIKLHYSKKDFNCGNLTINYNKYARNLFENNKYSMKISGYFMLFVQYLTAFRKEFLFVNTIIYILSHYLYNNKKIKNIINLYIICSYILMTLHISFLLNFILNLRPKETDWF
jgi:hypothetical protein